MFSCAMLYSQEDGFDIEYPFAKPGEKVSRGVFGDGDRKEVKDAEGYEDFVRATAVMVSKKNIYQDEFYSWSLREILKKKFGTNKFADNVKFLDQPAIGSCTGFLIAPNILVTAGHCIKDINQYVWVFDYTYESEFIDNKKLNFKVDNIYEVQQVLASKLDDYTKDDYAFLRLFKSSDRAPYRFRTSGKVLNNSEVNTLGCPTGLPLKFSRNAKVIDNSPDNWFKSDIDAFPGNSGGPVFDKNGFIEGILVRGAVAENGFDDIYTGDYKYNASCDCIETENWESVKYTAGCQSQKITSFPSDVLTTAIYENIAYAIKNNLSDRLNSWSIYKWIFGNEFKTEQNSLERMAINFDNVAALEKILKIMGENMPDDIARVLLDEGIINDNLTALKRLLNNGILADAGYNSSYTALQRAVSLNKVYIAEQLITYGANTQVKKNKNLLHLAATTGNFKMVNLLLENGIDANERDNNRKQPEKIAKKSDYKKLHKYLKKLEKENYKVHQLITHV